MEEYKRRDAWSDFHLRIAGTLNDWEQLQLLLCHFTPLLTRELCSESLVTEWTNPNELIPL